jgi:hypothetical protein
MIYDTNAMQNAQGDKELDLAPIKLTREHTNQESLQARAEPPKVPIEYHRKSTNCKTAKIPIEYHRRNTNLRITKTAQKDTTLLGIKFPIKRIQAPPQPRATNKAKARK